MRGRLQIFAQLAIFWLAYFSLARIAFLIYQFPSTQSLTASEVLMPLLLGLRMDAAMAGYWLILVGLLLTASPVLSNNFLKISTGVLVVFLLVLSTTIVVLDLELYRHWGFRMNTTPLMYARTEGVGSASVPALIILPLTFTAIVAGFILFYVRWIAPRFSSLAPITWKKSWVLLLLTAALFIPIRSSFRVAPLNTGVVYFHRTNMFPNHAGINVVWNFFKSLSTVNSLQYPNDFFPAEESARIMASLTHTDSTHHILKSTRPNVILIIMESFTAKVIEPLGGMKGVAPNFSTLFREGVGFANVYSSGDRTDKGIVTILSSYPAQTKTSIIKFPEKTEKLPFLPRHLKQLGYTPTFVYGGDIGFANMESYLTMAGFDHITEDDDFDQRESKWGVHDGFVFERLLAECDTASQAFFKVMLALSSHEPFDVPHRSPFFGPDEQSQFLNACHYSDSALGAFIADARTREWWNNTLIIITADHGHRFPQEAQLSEASRFHIPMVWTGGAIAKQDTMVQTVMSQTDLANTLLAQLHAPSADFSFSKNILSSGITPFAIYVFNNGYGYVDEEGPFRYDFDMKDFIGERPPESSMKRGHAYMQTLFSDYNHR